MDDLELHDVRSLSAKSVKLFSFSLHEEGRECGGKKRRKMCRGLVDKGN